MKQQRREELEKLLAEIDLRLSLICDYEGENSASVEIFNIAKAAIQDALSGVVCVPSEITAETGHKGKLSGEFKEFIDLYNEDEEDFAPYPVTIGWPNIKDIYKEAVKERTRSNLEKVLNDE